MEEMDEVLDNSKEATLPHIDPVGLQLLITEEKGLLLDSRAPELFTKGFIPGSISIGEKGSFMAWVNALLPQETPVYLVTDAGRESIIAGLLRKAGYHVAGAVQGGFDGWQAAGLPIDLIIDVEPDEVAMDLPFDKAMVIVDVRLPAEFADGHVKQAISIPLVEMTDPLSLTDLEEDQNIYLYCGSGYRSVIAASLMKKQGIHNLRNIVGGYQELIKESRIETEKDKTMLN